MSNVAVFEVSCALLSGESRVPILPEVAEDVVHAQMVRKSVGAQGIPSNLLKHREKK